MGNGNVNHVQATLYYVHDPMCSWCWGFRSAWQQLQLLLPKVVRIVTVVGGLAADSEQPMPQPMQQYLQQTWRQIEQRIPGTQFNHAFWERCRPRRSTYPACRAVIAAAQWHHADAMTAAIQRAYFLEARNPSDEETLVALAAQLGIEPATFAGLLHSEQTRIELVRQLNHSRELGVQGFPSLILQQGNVMFPIPVHYVDPQAMLTHCLDIMK